METTAIYDYFKRRIRKSYKNRTPYFLYYRRPVNYVEIYNVYPTKEQYQLVMEVNNPTKGSNGWYQSKEVYMNGNIHSKKRFKLVPITEAELMMELM